MPLLDVVIRILLALFLGGLIGLEREIREHSAGFRTHILVAVGAAVFTLASSYGLEGTDHDPNRISAQVVTGIGFLGAGAIIRYGVTVRGLTTAASLWAVAAVGLTVGQGFYSAALVTTATVIVSLYVLGLIEKRVLYKRVGTAVGVKVHFRSGGYTPLTLLLSALENAHVTVKEMAVVPGEEDAETLHLRVSLPRTLNPPDLLRIMSSLKEVESATLD
jgi:putative Mg2+ transporter-C (MgtC) family protein